MNEKAPRIDVIVLNWNGRDDTLECLASMSRLDYPSYRVVVVDNGSADGSVAAIREQHPGVVILETGTNLGYAGGNNVGIKWSLSHGADAILLLNNDTVVAPDLLSALTRAARKLPEGSVIGAAICFFDRPNLLWFGGAHWVPEEVGFRITGRRQDASVLPEQPAETDYATGCALFAPASTFRAVGLLDEDFFLTYEETDWCYRARALGFRSYVEREARLWHKVSASFGGIGSPLVRYFLVRNRLRWGKRHLPLAQSWLLHRESLRILWGAIAVPFDWRGAAGLSPRRWLWAVATWGRALGRNFREPGRRAELLGLRDYYLGRFGDSPSEVRRFVQESLIGSIQSERPSS